MCPFHYRNDHKSFDSRWPHILIRMRDRNEAAACNNRNRRPNQFRFNFFVTLRRNLSQVFFDISFFYIICLFMNAAARLNNNVVGLCIMLIRPLTTTTALYVRAYIPITKYLCFQIYRRRFICARRRRGILYARSSIFFFFLPRVSRIN